MNNKPFAPTFFLILGILIFSGLIFLVGKSAFYFLLPVSERVLHPEHGFFRSSGVGGLSFGLAGTILIFLNLTYLIRKEFIHVEWVGVLRSWMAFHVFTGLLGGTLVLLHGNFLPRSALGTLAYVGLWVVIGTGVMGRYIYARTPRSMEGRELELAEIKERIQAYQLQLEKWGVSHDLFSRSEKLDTMRSEYHGILRSFMGLLVGSRETRKSFKDFRQALRKKPELQSMSNVILPLARKYYQEGQWVARYSELRSLMSSWRFFHRWFAITMLVAAVFHIVVAYVMGNLWMFRG